MFARREQAVVIGANAESCPAAVTGKNRFNSNAQFFSVTILRQLWMLLDCAHVIIDRDNVPERCVDGIELRLFAAVGKTIWQHSFRNNASPLNQNVARIFESSASNAQSADRDKCVAAPIAKPRIARD